MLAAVALLVAASPIVIGHRGCSAERPEHTLAAYERAIEQGADYIEPDLVPTKDGVLIARHENEISGTTDVENRPEFADRKTTKTIDGGKVTGWFTEDFTLAELRTLKARERLPALRTESAKFDGQFGIPTFREVIELAKRKGVGVYPETKHPRYFRGIGLPLEERVAAELKETGFTKVFLQSFEVESVRRLKELTALPTVQLIDAGGAPYDFEADKDPRTYKDLLTDEGLKFVKTYADGIGVTKNLVVPRAAGGVLGKPTDLVARAHAAGLLVHVWTFRDEPNFLPRGVSGDPATELRAFLATGIDGVFADRPATARALIPRQ